MQFWAIWSGVKKTLISEGKERDEAIEEAQLHLASVETQLKEKKFFGGERLGFVEIVASVLVWIDVAQEAMGGEILTQDKFPGVHELTQRFAQDAVFNQCLPPMEQLIAHMKGHVEAAKASK